jgi:hypothetical protein
MNPNFSILRASFARALLGLSLMLANGSISNDKAHLPQSRADRSRLGTSVIRGVTSQKLGIEHFLQEFPVLCRKFPIVAPKIPCSVT